MKVERNKVCLVIAVISATIFLYIFINVILNGGLPWDDIRLNVYNLRSNFLNHILIPITYTGNASFIEILILLLFIFCRGKARIQIALPMALISLVSVSIQTLIKNFVQRSRPDIYLHLVEQGGFSFPSGHSMSGLIAYGSLIFLINRYYKKYNEEIYKTGKYPYDVVKKGFSKTEIKIIRIISLVIGLNILLIGFSRIYVGVHYPSDVIGGWSLGLAILSLFILSEKHWKF